MVEIHPGIKIDVPDAPWSEPERLAWYWQEPIKCSEWAERYVVIEKSDIPGPFSFDNAPYLRGMVDIPFKPGVRKVTKKKSVQMGVSLGIHIEMGYVAHMRPAPAGLALPNKEKGRQIVGNEVIPFFRDNFRRHPELCKLFTGKAHDVKKCEIKLVNPFLLYLMWAGSPTSMSSAPMRYAWCDETNKFVEWSGNDADPISLIHKRLRTYSESLLELVSSPTDSLGYISVHFEACTVKLYFLVACPHCGVRQRLIFGEGSDHGVKWSEDVRRLMKDGFREKAAAAVMQDGACWYQCAACHEKISERQKRNMVKGGKWGTIEHDSGGRPGILADGEIGDAEAINEFPRETRVGMHISALYCMWESCTLAHVAAEFIRAGSMQQLFDFRTGTLGEDWEQATKKVDSEDLLQRTKAAPKHGILPQWTGRLIGVVDTQKDHFYLVIRAWGPGMRSRRIWHGKVQSFEEIDQWCFRTPFANEDPRLPARTCDQVYIDSGGTRRFDEEAQTSDEPLPSRVMDVYAWCLKNTSRVFAIKGDAKPLPGSYMRPGRGIMTTGRKATLPIILLNVHHFQDELADIMERKLPIIDVVTGEVLGEELAWQLNDAPDQDYSKHLSNMQRVCEGKGAEMKWRWRPVRDGARVDYRMIEVYQVAAAYKSGVNLLPDLPTFIQSIEAAITHRGMAREEKRFETPGGQSFVATQR